MNPITIALLVLISVPMIELYVLISVGSEIGAFSTIALTLFTAALGIWLVRLQGLGTALRAREAMARGETPAMEMMEGALLSVAGFMLLFPGFISDSLGFLLLLPPLRKWLVLNWIKKISVSGAYTTQTRTQSRRTLEGEYRRHDD
ncbi:MAG: FxsA family protein [gamma proteobacterium symbiont of Bathyaustriella thionipta]|nr:FxsA family protein [gamma proteobacterium symbiont of Bathyaustriella thionipta]